MSVEETWHTVQEVAALLRVGPEAVSEYCRDGLFPGAYKEGTRWRIPHASVREWMAGWKVYLVRRGIRQKAVVSARTTGEAKRVLASNCGTEGPDAWYTSSVKVERIGSVERDATTRILVRGAAYGEEDGAEAEGERDTTGDGAGAATATEAAHSSAGMDTE
jgi:excisionase family DNA binding protein